MSNPLRIAIIHYHLRRGGVTRVMEHAASVLSADTTRIVFLGGEAPTEPLHVPVEWRVVEGLGYADVLDIAPETLVRRMRAAAEGALGGAVDVWHIHNHTLGKNPVVPLAVRCLAEAGERLLLQLHDFPEDGRPANYQNLLHLLAEGDRTALADRLYPLGKHVQYAVINRRDEAFLLQAGMPREQLHYLPNTVELEVPVISKSDVAESDERLYLYPTRAIRRKNMGEFLFWAALAEEGDHFAATLAPKNPAARPVYDRWVALAGELGLSVTFEYAKTVPDLSFAEVLERAHAVVSTSVAEGFGLAFLEPWLAGTPLVGRKLPEITDEFEQAGLDLSSMYTRLPVPLDWVGEDRFRARLSEALIQSFAAYGETATEDDVALAFQTAVCEGHVDFGLLDESMQEDVLRRLVRDIEARNTWPQSRLQVDRARTAVPENQIAVADGFQPATYGNRLATLYRLAAEATPGPLGTLDGECLLRQFLAPERFCLLRT